MAIARAGDAANVDDVAALSAGHDVAVTATSLVVPGAGWAVLDDPGFPPDWSYLSPAAVLEPGERTGRYRLGRDELVVDADGNSTISTADLAAALVDEAERPRHRGVRFAVGY